jgi:DUF2958 family protein
MRTEIFPDELLPKLPPLGSEEGISDPVVHMKFFTRDADWGWYVTEGSTADDDFMFFGFVFGIEQEWGYFSLSELTKAYGPSGFPVEHDLHFEPDRFSKVMAREIRWRTSRPPGNLHIGNC